MNNQLLDFEIRDLNVHNVLAALAILSFLKVEITDLGEKFKSLESSIGRGKKYSIFRIPWIGVWREKSSRAYFRIV